MNNLELLTFSANPEVVCDTEGSALSNLFNLLKSLGNLKPSSIVKSSRKGIRVSKRNNNGKVIYVLTILDFDPPVNTEWTSPLSIGEMLQIIRSIINTSRSVTHVNLLKINGGATQYQLALSSQ